MTFFMDASRSGRASNSQHHVFTRARVGRVPTVCGTCVGVVCRALCRAVRARARARVPVYLYLVTFTHREAAEISQTRATALSRLYLGLAAQKSKGNRVSPVCVCREL